MKTIRRLIPKTVSILTAAVLLMVLSFSALAYDSGTSGDDTIITMDAGEKTFTYLVKFDKIEEAFASAQFNIKVDDVNGVKATGISFSRDIRDKARDGGGTTDTISSRWKANGNQVTYMAGFLSTENQFEGELEVATITFSYMSNTPQTITLSDLEIYRLTGKVVDGIAEVEKTDVPWEKTITVSRGAITPTVAAPTASPAPGTYESTRHVTLSSTTAGAKIYYTLDGSDPTRSSTLYSGSITVDESMTIKAFAIKDGYTDSPAAAFAYTISGGPTIPKADAPTANPAPGTYASTRHVTLSSATAGAKIYYTINGSNPTHSSTLYSDPITVDKSMTIKALAAKDGYSDSPVATFSYTISGGSSGDTGGSGGGTGGTGIEEEQPPAAPALIEFKDVGPEYAWAKDAIGSLAARGVILGDNLGNFLPAYNVTRADFVVMIARLVDLGEAGGGPVFSDVPEGQYYTDAISKASKAGIINGTGNGKFSPKEYITRQDAFVILYRLLGLLGKTDGTQASISTFNDASSVAPHAQQAMAFLVGKGIVQGNQGLLNPTQNITRAETAVILYRIAVMFDL